MRRESTLSPKAVTRQSGFSVDSMASSHPPLFPLAKRGVVKRSCALAHVGEIQWEESLNHPLRLRITSRFANDSNETKRERTAWHHMDAFKRNGQHLQSSGNNRAVLRYSTHCYSADMFPQVVGLFCTTMRYDLRRRKRTESRSLLIFLLTPPDAL